MIYKTFTIKAIAIERDLEESEVPCGDCSECCIHLSPILTPDEFASGQYCYTLTNSPDNNKPLLSIPRDESGCYYFKEYKCSIYERRPKACRQFDCRKGHYFPFKDLVKDKFGVDINELELQV